MSAKSSPSNTQGSSPSGQSSSPPAMKAKGSTSPNADVELKTMRPNAPPPSIPIGEDIMQLARIGEIGAMQNLFTTKKLTASYRDEEGITPLHVCFPSPLHPPDSHAFALRQCEDHRIRHDFDTNCSCSNSGRLSTINMRCASSFLTPVPT